MATTLLKHSYFVYLIHSKSLQTIFLSSVVDAWERALSVCMESKLHLDIPACPGLLRAPPAPHVHWPEQTPLPGSVPAPRQSGGFKQNFTEATTWSQEDSPCQCISLRLHLELISGGPKLSPWSTSMVQRDAQYLQNTEFYLKKTPTIKPRTIYIKKLVLLQPMGSPEKGWLHWEKS